MPPILTPPTIDNPHDLTPLVQKSHKYEAIVDECLTALRMHRDIMNWIRRYLGLVPGDCWNISAICAELASQMDMFPEIIGISGPIIEHMECLTPAGGDNYRCWWVTPFNHVGHFNFHVSTPIPLDLYKSYWSTIRQVSKFTGPVVCENGHDVQRRVINLCHPENMEAVLLVNMDNVVSALKQGDYDITYSDT